MKVALVFYIILLVVLSASSGERLDIKKAAQILNTNGTQYVPPKINATLLETPSPKALDFSENSTLSNGLTQNHSIMSELSFEENDFPTYVNVGILTLGFVFVFLVPFFSIYYRKNKQEAYTAFALGVFLVLFSCMLGLLLASFQSELFNTRLEQKVKTARRMEKFYNDCVNKNRVPFSDFIHGIVFHGTLSVVSSNGDVLSPACDMKLFQSLEKFKKAEYLAVFSKMIANSAVTATNVYFGNISWGALLALGCIATFASLFLLVFGYLALQMVPLFATALSKSMIQKPESKILVLISFENKRVRCGFFASKLNYSMLRDNIKKSFGMKADFIIVQCIKSQGGTEEFEITTDENVYALLIDLAEKRDVVLSLKTNSKNDDSHADEEKKRVSSEGQVSKATELTADIKTAEPFCTIQQGVTESVAEIEVSPINTNCAHAQLEEELSQKSVSETVVKSEEKMSENQKERKPEFEKVD